MLTVTSLKKTFYKDKKHISTVLSDISFQLHDGEKLALAGASGTGKSTIARILTGLECPDSGSVRLDGRELWSAAKHPRYDREHGRKIQMIFQSPYDSLDPVQRVGRAVEEALIFSGESTGRRDAASKREELFGLVGLPLSMSDRLPGALSGGQAQRVALARALALAPDILIADEATSMLDMTSQAQIMRLLADLNERRGLSLIIISHDDALLSAAADRILLLDEGRLSPLSREGKEGQ